MPPIYVFEDSQVERLFPLTYTRAAFELRSGNLTLLDRLRKLPQPIAGLLVRPALAEIVRHRITDIPVNPPLSTKDGLLLINARCLLLKSTLWNVPEFDSVGLSQGSIAWMCLSPKLAGRVDLSKLQDPRTLESLFEEVRRGSASSIMINHPWDLFEHQRAAIVEDFEALGPAKDGIQMTGSHLLNPSNIHLAQDVKIWPGAVLDAQNGPIIVGQGTQIRANSVITGPVAIGEHCVIRNMADIREETSLGPNCRVGGEIIGSIFLGNSNKQHHGFVGQSIICEWVNLGAGTTTSNVKNTYGSVRMTLNGKDEPTGRQFLGSLIADHVKLGIGTYLSTGSVVGFASHVVVPRPPRVVPSFAWLTEKGMARADFEKLEEIAGIAMKRRGVDFTTIDHALFVHIASVWSQAEQYPWPDH
ncbi:MAG TPA: putative sugar nucleotidyl transferase [Phycisphaerae bacterium]|jgi:UDP-N-acetylglucosamine diphosphorylase/glucosamine-1-phosphate N-acetyltransferase